MDAEAAALKNARSGLLRLLGYRQRSRQEAVEYLRRKGFSEAVTAAVIAEMEQWGYLDDRRFAVDCIESYLRRGYGPLRVRRTLLDKGVHREIIEAELTRRYSAAEELALARELLRRRSTAGEDFTEGRWIRRQAAYLQRRGFSGGVVARTLREHGCSSFDDDPVEGANRPWGGGRSNA